MPVARISDPKRVFASISLERERSAPLSAFLGFFGPGDGAWTWRAGGATNISFLVHLTRAPFSPVAIGYGPASGVENLLATALPELPARLSLHFPVAQRDAFARLFTLDVEAFTTCSLALAGLPEPDHRVHAEELGEGASQGLSDLLAHDAASAFGKEPPRTGLTLGLSEHGRLVGVASAPVVSKEFRTALITHVVVSPEVRRKGVAAALHYALAQRLAAEGIEVVAMVVRDANEAGHALLASLGYARREHILIGTGSMRGAASPSGRPPALVATGSHR